WGEALPADPEGALRTQISRLRKALGPGADVVTEDRAYRLTVARDQIDVARFEDLMALLARGGAQGADGLRLIDEALALWRGPPLAEVADRAFAQPEAVRLAGLHLAAREQRAEILLTLGRAAEAAADLDSLLAEHPARERARGLLMEALYHQGRHSEAVATYRTWRRHLADELGLEPSPALQRIEGQVLAHTLPAREEAASPRRRPHRLALPVSSFVGRDDDVSAVRRLLEEVRLLTLCGPAGVGKTRLAIEVCALIADRYPDGLHFCDLAAVTRPGDVVRTVAGVIGVEERALRTLDARLLEHLAGRRTLLLLDNCEHVLGAVAALAERTIQQTGGVDVLATSRERLAVDGEHLWTVTPLAVGGGDAPAVRLFVDRARAVDVGFTPGGDGLATVADVCRRLDGLPLAIELAAARLPGLGLEDLARSLDQRFLLLTGGPRTSSRHRSLRAVLDWSYAQLEPVVQSVFERLATFAGRFDLVAAGAVASGDGVERDAVTPAVLRLVDCSLLTGHPGIGPDRYSLLDTMRSYGLERLMARDDLARARDRHALWALELAEQAAGELAGPREGEWARAVREHLDELRAAHAWLVGCDPEAGLRLAVALHPYALWRVQSEILRWAEVAAGASAGSGSRRLSAVLASAAAGAWQRGDLDAARAAATAALEAARDLDRPGQRPALEARADVAILLGDLPEADTLFRETYELALSAGDLLQAVWDGGSASLARAWSGDAEAADDLAASTFATAERSGSPTAKAFAHYVLGEISTSKDASAEEHLCHAIELAQAVDSTFVVGLARVALATLKARQDDAAGALRSYEAVIVEWQRAGAWTSQWVTLRTLVDLLVRVGADRDAAILYGAVDTARTGARPFGAD
ncbi:MAG TPA: BTAD domain-containing putative transcriptional regulator, partial [Acidimicrobiia bacterium]|nr:BTAD domain-containing putative transcriptional regulator [Acidimicrobiia bacterium]